MKNHYIYQITYNTGKKYIGVRSCECSIEADPYMGSCFNLPDNLIGCKEILSIHTTREEAMKEEIRLHTLYNVKDNPDFYNQCNATSTKFQVSEEANKRGAETRRGRTKHTHEYIAKQVEARRKYKGENLTPAQQAQWAEHRKEERRQKYLKTLEKTMQDPEKAAKIQDARVRGGKSGTGIPNPKKALPGLKHGKAKAWWYKQPDGNIMIVNDSIRGFYKKNPNTLPVKRDRVMEYLRTKIIPTYLKELGWDFGFIDGQEITNPVE